MEKYLFVETNVKNNFNFRAIPNTVGLRHPFIPYDESVAYMKRCQHKRVHPSLITAKYSLYKDWIVNAFDMMGNAIRIDCKYLDRQRQITIYSVIGVFDCKVE